MADATVKLLGGFSVVVGGREVEQAAWNRRHAATLVKALALAPGRTSHREQLIDLIWSDDPADAGPRLHKAAHFARRALGLDGAVVLAQEQISLLPGYEVDVDALAFEHAGEEALRSEKPVEASAAADLYSGLLLPGDLYESWSEEARERLRLLHLQLLRRAGRWRDLVRYDPSDESAYVELVRSAVASGDVGLAESIARQMRTAVTHELGVEPSEPTMRLVSELVASVPRRTTEIPIAAREGSAFVGVGGRFEPAAPVTVLERDEPLAVLQRRIDDCRDSARGSVVLVAGEAGVGKTTLVRELLHRVETEILTVVGHCDDLVTPRALGPFRDVADLLGLPNLPAEGEDRFLQRLLGVIGQQPTVVVVEDVHWADDATADAVAILGRRVSRFPLVLVVTYRDEDVPDEHPMRSVLGTLTGDLVDRIRVEPLSRAAVAELAVGSGLDPDVLHASTRGNPFFATEVIGLAPEDAVPATVRDAVLGRLARLPVESRRLLGRLSVAPNRLEREYAERLADDGSSWLAVAERRGLVSGDLTWVWFRHELARRAIEDALPFSECVRAHNAVMRLLMRSPDIDPARVVHHAERAGDDDVVSDYALRAARRAATLSAHGEAWSHYQRVLGSADLLPAEERAVIMRDASREAYLSSDAPEGIRLANLALDTFSELGDLDEVGRCHRWLSRLYWFAGDGTRAEESSQRAIEVLEPLGPGTELAWAYSTRSQLAALDWRNDEALTWGARAVRLAEQMHEPKVKAHALVNIGFVKIRREPTNLALLLDAAENADRVGEDHESVRALVNLAYHLTENFQLERAREVSARSLQYADEHEVLPMLDYQRVVDCEIALLAGEWIGLQDRVIRAARGGSAATVFGRRVLAQLQVRQGDGAAAATMERAMSEAETTGEAQRLLPLLNVRAESAWLEGRLPDLRDALEPAVLRAAAADERCLAGELALWLVTAGGQLPSGLSLAEPHTIELGGDGARTAHWFESRGMPYEAARALVRTGTDLPRARVIAAELGSTPLLRFIDRAAG